MILPWVRLSAVWNELDMVHPNTHRSGAQSTSRLNLAVAGHGGRQI
jgi:hypothetical protein